MEVKDYTGLKQLKREYVTPRLIVYGSVDLLTRGFPGQFSDWLEGDPGPPGMCDPDAWYGHICPTS